MHFRATCARCGIWPKCLATFSRINCLEKGFGNEENISISRRRLLRPWHLTLTSGGKRTDPQTEDSSGNVAGCFECSGGTADKPIERRGGTPEQRCRAGLQSGGTSTVSGIPASSGGTGETIQQSCEQQFGQQGCLRRPGTTKRSYENGGSDEVHLYLQACG